MLDAVALSRRPFALTVMFHILRPVLNFGVGVVSGMPLEFEFGTSWAPFSIAAAGVVFGYTLLGAMLAFLMRSLHKGLWHAPFVHSQIVFPCSFAGLAVSLYPYLLPPTVTIAKAASPKTLVFMLTGIGMLLSIMPINNGFQYFGFRGKVSGGYSHHSPDNGQFD